MAEIPRENQRIAAMLREAAELLKAQDADPFRVGAYRRGADTIEDLEESVEQILRREGPQGLMELPNIGSGLTGTMREIVRSGRWSLLERLRGEVDPEQLFQTIPGVGPELAERIHDELHVDTLEALEVAAHDGCLAQVPGIGTKRSAGIRASLASMLGRRPRRSIDSASPSVDLLLAVDREYRRAAAAGELSTIAPRRFNPEGESWLPSSAAASRFTGTSFDSLEAEIAALDTLTGGIDWTTSDPLGLGGLLTDCHRLLELVVRGRSRDFGLLERLLDASVDSLGGIARRQPFDAVAEDRLAFRELGLAIGLAVLPRMLPVIEREAKALDPQGTLRARLEQLAEFGRLRDRIETFWRRPANRAGASWQEHRDINDVMLATSLVPDEFLSI